MNAVAKARIVPPIDMAAPQPAVRLLRVENLRSGYGAIEVLHGISFDVAAGEILAIVGANGAGKSTLLRTVSGLLKPASGHIWFDGEDIGGKECAEIVARGISQSPEGRRVFSGLTVEENLKLGAFRRRERGALPGRLERVYQQLPKLRDRRRQLAGTLSGGEQQMCALGRALMAEPQLLIVDELSLGLAPVVVEELLRILNDIHAAGTTVVLVEQDVSVALRFSDRAIVLQAGAVALEGPSDQLINEASIIKSYLGG